MSYNPKNGVIRLIQNTLYDVPGFRAGLLQGIDPNGSASIRSLEAGQGVTLVIDDSDSTPGNVFQGKIIINAPGVLTNVLTLGTGYSVVNGTNAGNIEFHSLIGGTNVDISLVGDSLVFSTTAEANTGINVGTGVGVYKNKVGADLQFRTLTSDGIIQITEVGDEIHISSNGAGESNAGVNLGTLLDGKSLYTGKSGTDLLFRRLNASGYINVVENADNLVITTSAEPNSAINLGTSADGAVVYDSKVGENLSFKRIRGQGLISVSSTAESVIITTNAEQNSAVNLGTQGGRLYSGKTGTNLEFRRIIGSGNVNVVENGDYIELNVVESQNAVNIGTGHGIFDSLVGGNFEFRSLVAGNNIGIVSGTDSITINSPDPGEINTASNLGTGIGIYESKLGTNLQFRTLLSGSGINLVDTGNEIVVHNTMPIGEVNTGANVGPNGANTAGVFKDKTAQQLNFKRIVGSSTIGVVETLDTINLDVVSWPAFSAVNNGTGLPVFDTIASGTFNFNTLKAGTNVQLSLSGNEITISSIDTDTGEVNIGNNLGSGSSIYTGKSGVSLNFKTVVSGPGISITDTGTELHITNSFPGEVNNGNNVGAIGANTAGIYRDKTAQQLNFKRLVAGTNVNIVENLNDIVISSIDTDTGEVNQGVNLGTGNNLYAGKTGTDLRFKTIIGATNINIMDTGDELIISSIDTGETNSGISLGGDADIYSGKSGTDLLFKGLSVGTGLQLIDSMNHITLVNLEPGEYNFGANVGTTGINTAGIFKDKTAQQLNFKRLVGGSNINITETVNDILISSVDTGEVNTASNLGAGYGIYHSKNGVDLRFKSLNVTGGMSITDNGSEITIDKGFVGEVNQGVNLGTGEAVYNGKIGSDLEFKTLIEGNGVNLISGTDSILVINTEPGEYNFGANVGPNGVGTAGLYKDKTGVTLNFKRIVSGSNINVVENLDNIVISSIDTGEVNSAVNIGTTGSSVYAGKNGVDLQFRKITGSAGIVVVEGTDTIMIAPSVLGEINSGLNVGTGEQLYAGKIGNDLLFRTLTNGNGISLIQVGNEIIVQNTERGEYNYGVNVGPTGVNTAGIYEGKTGPSLNFKRLIGNGNITLTENANHIVISGVDTGEVNTASNLGAGYGIFDSKIGTDLKFKSIRAGTNINIVDGTDSLEIYTLSELNDAVNLAAEAIYAGKNGSMLQFRGIQEGTGINIVAGTDRLIIENTERGEYNFGANVGMTGVNTAGIYKDKTDVTLNFKRIVGNNISVTDNANEIVLSSTAENNSGINLGTGYGIYVGKNDVDLQFRSLVAGNGIVLNQNSDSITIQGAQFDILPGTGIGVSYGTNSTTIYNTNPGEVNTGNNLGAGIGLFRNKTAQQLNFKSIDVSGNASILDGTETILIDVPMTNMINVGTGSGVYKNRVGQDFNFKTIQAGTNIVVDSTGDELVIQTLAEINSAVNLGSSGVGAAIYAGKNGIDLEFKRIVAGNNCWIDDLGGYIEINTEGEINNGTNLGTGVGIFAGKPGLNLQFRTLINSNNVDVVDLGNEIRLDVNLPIINNGTTVNSGSLYRDTVSGTINLRKIVGKNGLIVNQTPDTVELDAAGLIESGTNLGSPLLGNAVYSGKIGNSLQFKRLISGPNISIDSSDPEYIRISSIDTGEINTASNLGNGLSIFDSKMGSDLRFNSIKSGTNVNISLSSNTLTVDSYTGLISSGTGSNLIQGSDGANNILKSVLVQNGLIIANTANEIVLDSSNLILDGTNLGTIGTDIFAGKTGQTLKFRQIVSGTGISINATDPNYVEIATYAEINQAVNTGNGYGLYSNKTGAILQFKSVESGTGINIVDTGTTLIINGSFGTIIDAGTANSLISNVIDNNIELKTISGGTGIIVNSSVTNLEIATDCYNAVVNLGTGSELAVTSLPNVLDFKTIVAGTNISIVDTGSELLINCPTTLSGVDTAINIGGGTPVFDSKSGNDLRFRTLVAGNGIDLDTVADTIVIKESGMSSVLGAVSGSAYDLTFVNDSAIELTLNQNTVLNIVGTYQMGKKYEATVVLIQDGAGNRTVTWPGNIRWPNGLAPVLSTGANAIDIIDMFTINGGTTWFGKYNLNY